MLKQVAQNTYVHTSEFLLSQTTIIQGASGLLLVDPGITSAELSDIAKDIKALGQPVAAGFSTHPDWDHVLWHAAFGEAPRYATAKGAAEIQAFLANPDWRTQLVDYLPPEHSNEIPLDDVFGKTTALPAEATHLPWDGPEARIIEHRAHAKGHAALCIKEYGVLVAGDMLSDILIPFLDLEAADPVQDYLQALQLLEDTADDVAVIIPGHGSVGDTAALRARIKQDRSYVRALASGGSADDPRLTDGPNKDWLPSVYEWQVKQLAQK